MAVKFWVNPNGGLWETGANWDPTGAPASGDDALLSDLGPDYTVTVSAGQIDSANLLAFIADVGSPTLSINGTLTVGTLEYALDFAPSTLDVNAGGTFNVTTNILDFLTPAETITVSGVGTGGHLTLGAPTIGDIPTLSFAFNNSGPTALNTGVIEIDGAAKGDITTQNITNIARGDEFVLPGLKFGTGNIATLTGSTLKVTTKAGVTNFTMDNVFLESGATNAFAIVNGNTIEAVCYARGTMLRIPDGEQPVETLRPGQRVITLVDGDEVTQTVRWLGHRRIDLTRHPRPETVAPIRIERDAFAAGMPHRDLLVSPDHAIFVDGKLICARQLVNGTTIRRERGWSSVNYYHVELDQHAILLAEGLPAESYLDTGNRGFFADSGMALVLHPDLTDETGQLTREANSCAPFVTDETSVRPVWERLVERAAAIGRPTARNVTTTDADLRLVADRRTIKPVFKDNDRAIFALPRGASEVRLVSRAQAPTEARPWLSDSRRLGARVKRIVLRGADETREIPMDHPDFTRGWWDIEHDGPMMSRWTDGDAVLPAMVGPAILEIHFAGAMTYAVDTVAEGVAERRAA